MNKQKQALLDTISNEEKRLEELSSAYDQESVATEKEGVEKHIRDLKHKVSTLPDKEETEVSLIDALQATLDNETKKLKEQNLSDLQREGIRAHIVALQSRIKYEKSLLPEEKKEI